VPFCSLDSLRRVLRTRNPKCEQQSKSHEHFFHDFLQSKIDLKYQRKHQVPSVIFSSQMVFADGLKRIF
jgi:hypothetical protein